jgi:hypothetical protein
VEDQYRDEPFCAQPACGHPQSLHVDGGGCSGTSGDDSVGWMFCMCSGFVAARSGLVTTRLLSDLWAHVQVEFLGHLDRPVGPEGRPYWRASKVGYCLRSQCLWRAGVKPTRIEDPDQQADKERRFEWGHRMERHVVLTYERAGLLVVEQLPLTDQNLSVEGHADAVYGGVPTPDLPSRSRWWEPDFVWAVQTFRSRVAQTVNGPIPITGVEVKSTHGGAVKKMLKEGARFDHRMQSGTYKLIAARHPEQMPVPLERFELVVVGRDAVRPLIYSVTDADARQAEDRLGNLNEAWTTGSWPNCDCGRVPGMEWLAKYCDYGSGGDGCCGQGLLELLEASFANS